MPEMSGRSRIWWMLLTGRSVGDQRRRRYLSTDFFGRRRNSVGAVRRTESGGRGRDEVRGDLRMYRPSPVRGSVVRYREFCHHEAALVSRSEVPAEGAMGAYSCGEIGGGAEILEDFALQLKEARSASSPICHDPIVTCAGLGFRAAQERGILLRGWPRRPRASTGQFSRRRVIVLLLGTSGDLIFSRRITPYL